MFDCIKNLFSINSYYNVQYQNNLYIITPKDNNYTNTLIFMHGLGDNGENYVSLFNSNNRPAPSDTKIILPTAPIRNMSIGMSTNSWFDFRGMINEKDICKYDVDNSTKYIIDIIENEVDYYNGDYTKIYVGGFSQGACIALNVGLQFHKQLGGIIALNGLLFPFSTNNVTEDKFDLRFFIVIGLDDAVIKYKLSELSYQPFNNNYKNVNIYKIENTGHWINPIYFPEIQKFISNI